MLEKMFAADRFLLTLCLFTGLALTLGWFLKDAAKGALEEPLKLTRAWLISAISILMTFSLVAAVSLAIPSPPPGWLMVLILSAIYFPISSIIFMFFTRVPFSKALLINFKWILQLTFLLVGAILLERAFSYFFDFDYLEWVKGVSKTEQ